MALMLLFSQFFIEIDAAAQNKKPFVIPELKEWTEGEGYFNPMKSNISVKCNQKEVYDIALAFSEDFNTMFAHQFKIKERSPRKGDIEFRIETNFPYGQEGYKIEIGNHTTISAKNAKGLFWATRTLLQMTELSEQHRWPKGIIVDYPDYPIRGFMIDCGRKFIPINYLRDAVKILAYYKMNTLQIHLNDCGICKYPKADWSKIYAGFRLECDTYPGLASPDGHYSKQEFIDLQILAEENNVEIIPEIDSPAHSLAFSRYKPEIGSSKYGMDHLDLFNPETYEFLDLLFKEYLEGESPVFRGPRVHIGTDEYSNHDQKVVEKFREYTDHYIKHVESFGKQACLWGALTHANGTTPVKSENVIMGAWYNGYAEPEEMIKQGYKLINMNDAFLYIVPAAGYYNDYLNTKFLYNEWTPARIGNKTFKEKHPSILGGIFAVWNDHINNGISVKDIHHRCYPAIQTIATKTWSAKKQEVGFEEFDQRRKELSEAPGVNQMAILRKTPGVVLKKEEIKPGENLPVKEIGYNYQVSFDLEAQKEEKGVTLFSCENAKFYLSDPIRGLMGFERDGYLNTFQFGLQEGLTYHITIEGSSTFTRLYVDGQLIGNLDTETFYIPIQGRKDKLLYHNVRTLVFPLEKAGIFNSKIKNLKVVQK